ncbi:MAG: carboxypeptidase regulatory-like domain-containing protein, partial [Acidobacteria bacterium]|nr:carboxypeptidase regulatory-like domain-containing protein [Acidobacteriota bacterium]
MSRNTTLLGLISLSLLLVISGPVYGQLNTATLSGTAKDVTGGVLPGVTITLTQVETGRVRTTITGDEGRYRASSLEVGTYQVAAELVGFQTLIQDEIPLTVGLNRVLDFVLSPGNISERVTVTASAALVDTTTSSVGGLVDEQQIRDLPLNGRDYVQLATLQAGVFKSRLGREYNVHRGSGTQLSINGARTDQNLFIPDGTNTNDFFNMTPGG